MSHTPDVVRTVLAAVLLALALTGTISSKLGGSKPRRAVLRVVTGGALAMTITYGIGQLAGVAGI